MVIAFVVYHNRLVIITPVDDPVTNVNNLRSVNTSLAFEVVKEVGKRAGMVVNVRNFLLLGFVTGSMLCELEGEYGGRGGDVRNGGGEKENHWTWLYLGTLATVE